MEKTDKTQELKEQRFTKEQNEFIDYILVMTHWREDVGGLNPGDYITWKNKQNRKEVFKLNRHKFNDFCELKD